ncbi:unnamed protein product, partial [Hapterophycus canaliculatus]
RLPSSSAQIDVMDYDDIGGDELIGRTVVDLEDRWFDQRWQVSKRPKVAPLSLSSLSPPPPPLPPRTV